MQFGSHGIVKSLRSKLFLFLSQPREPRAALSSKIQKASMIGAARALWTDGPKAGTAQPSPPSPSAQTAKPFEQDGLRRPAWMA